MPVSTGPANIVTLLPLGPSALNWRRRLRAVALVAILILPLCFLVTERCQARSEQQAQSTTQGESSSGIGGPAGFLVLGFMGVLAASTIGMWFLTWRSASRQASELAKFRAIATEAASASRAAASTAKASADALVSIERAYLFIDEDVEFEPVVNSSPVPLGDSASPGRPNYVIKFTFVNRGRTPAILDSIGMGVTPSLQQPARLDAAVLTLQASVPVGSVISANSRYERRLGCPFRMEQAQHEQVQRREARLYFLGRIGYKDVFGNRRETGFGLEFEPNSRTFMRVLSDQLNYYT